MSPIPAPHTITISWPASSPTPLMPAGLISREDPIANRSPATMKLSPRATRAPKSGIRWRKEPAFQRSSSVSRLSETQSFVGVIWSVSIASSFFPGTLGSQKMSALPRIAFAPPAAAFAATASLGSFAPGRSRADVIAFIHFMVAPPAICPTGRRHAEVRSAHVDLAEHVAVQQAVVLVAPGLGERERVGVAELHVR